MWGWIHTFEFDRQWFFVIVIRGSSVLHPLHQVQWMHVKCAMYTVKVEPGGTIVLDIYFFAIFVPFLNIEPSSMSISNFKKN